MPTYAKKYHFAIKTYFFLPNQNHNWWLKSFGIDRMGYDKQKPNNSWNCAFTLYEENCDACLWVQFYPKDSTRYVPAVFCALGYGAKIVPALKVKY